MIKNKRGTMTMTGLILTIILVMGLFYGTFNYVSSNYESADITVPLNYTDSYGDLQTAQDDLDTNIEDIKGAAQAISEADGNVVFVAWNGLTGLAYTLRLFLGVIDIGVATWNAILPGLGFLPPWVKILAEMAIIITIVLVIVGAFKGESKT